MTKHTSDSLLRKLNHNWRSELSQEAQDALDRHVTSLALGAGEYLYRCGDPGDTGFQVREGRVAVNSLSRDGRELLLAEMGPGDCLGDLGLVNSGVRVNCAIAVTRTEVTVLRRKDFEAVARVHPEIYATVSRMLGHRFQFLYALIQDASLLPLYDRLGRILIRLSLSERSQRTDPATVRIEDCPHEMLGNMVGAVRQSVGRELKKMEAQGLIRIEYRSIIILDYRRMVEEFGQMLDFEPLTAVPLGQLNQVAS